MILFYFTGKKFLCMSIAGFAMRIPMYVSKVKTRGFAVVVSNIMDLMRYLF